MSDSGYDELHLFASRLGMRRIGFQGDHYDLPARLLPSALAEGAAQIDSRVLVRRLRDAGLRKSPGYEGWTPLVRRDGLEIEQAATEVDQAVNQASPGSGRAAAELLRVCDSLWTTMEEQGASIHQLYVLSRPTQLAVAFDTDDSMAPHLHGDDPDQTDPAKAQVWVTGGNPLLAVDVLVER